MWIETARLARRPGLAPGIYFRLLLTGYFEGIDSKRGIAWRAADSLEQDKPDHPTISRTRRLIHLEANAALWSILRRNGGAKYADFLRRLAQESGIETFTRVVAGKGYHSNAMLVARSFAHVYQTGGLRRVWLRGRQNILKRVLIQNTGLNLTLVMRKLKGKGTPPGFQWRIRTSRAAHGIRVKMQVWL